MVLPPRISVLKNPLNRRKWLVVLAGILALSSAGCSVEFTEVGSPTTVRTQVQSETASGLTTHLTKVSDTDLEVNVAPGICISTYEERTPVYVKRKPSVAAGPGLAVAGVIVAGLATALFIDAHRYPRSCASSDDTCLSQGDARAVAAVGWGLGALGVGVGLYEGAKEPENVREEVMRSSSARTEQCAVNVEHVPVALRLARATDRKVTDADGNARFQVSGREWPQFSRALVVVGEKDRVFVDLSPFTPAAPTPVLPNPALPPHTSPPSSTCDVARARTAHPVSFALCSAAGNMVTSAAATKLAEALVSLLPIVNPAEEIEMAIVFALTAAQTYFANGYIDDGCCYALEGIDSRIQMHLP